MSFAIVKSISFYYYSNFSFKTFFYKYFKGYNIRLTHDHLFYNYFFYVVFIIKLTVLTFSKRKRFGFYNQSYIFIRIILTLKSLPNILNFDIYRYLNTSYAVIFINKNCLVYLLSNQLINKMIIFLSIKDIISSKYKINKYI